MYEKLASAIYNDVMGGLRGITSTPNLSMDQLIDDIVDERLAIIKEYQLKGLLPKKDLLLTLSCLKTSCEDLNKCNCGGISNKPTLHVAIPQLLDHDSIEYFGSTDLEIPFIVYRSVSELKGHAYRRRGQLKPYVYVDTTPNEYNMYDCWIFNAPMLRQVTVKAIFKDPRQAFEMGCCSDEEINNYNFIDNEIKRRLTEKKLRFYRQFASNITPNTQEPK